MSNLTREELKQKFKTGAKPTEKDFSDLIDSMLVQGDNPKVHNKVMYSTLKELRESSSLVPGALYRIIDYVTTTSQVNTKSAGHLFDVIVLALTNDTIAERAWVCHHEGDTYFQNSNLAAWQIWYCLDNDTTRFSWANTKNGKGVIYRMVDEFGNDCPYDFKNIQDDSSEYEGLYTFSFYNEDFSSYADYSVYSNQCYNNVIKPYYRNNIQHINCIYFDNSSGNGGIYSNTFGEGCHDICLGANAQRNTFGSEIYDCTFGNNFYLNVLGDKCYGNVFGNDCQGNTLGQVCSLNTIGDGFSNNIFGNVCHSNTIGNNFTHNVLSNNCHHNTFGDNCSSNKFGTGCYSNTFGKYFQRNDIGSLCNGNNFELNYVQYNTVSNGTRECTFTNSETAASGTQIQRYKIEGHTLFCFVMFFHIIPSLLHSMF